MTPTPTKTPTVTPTNIPQVFCGSGVTTGTHYYYDCCGSVKNGFPSGLIVVMDYNRPFGGIQKLDVPADKICPTPTLTPTPSITPTINSTPTVTPTITSTPTVTPSNTPYPEPSPVYKLVNDCEVFTVFDMGINCYVDVYPVSNESFDGVLKIFVTGGTSPYSFNWEGGQKTQTITGLRPGNYPVTVVDFYGDYTASTVCSLFPISPTPSITPTNTPTPTSTPNCTQLCLTAFGGPITYGPWQFICNGNSNGRQVWTYNSQYNIVWNPLQSRWVVVENDLVTPVQFSNGRIMSSSTPAMVPLALWVFLGDSSNRYNFSVIQGDCPTTIPFNISTKTTNTECVGTQNCAGSIIITPTGGLSPYMYSINNGATYQTSNIFNGLCSGTYLVKVKDSNDAMISRQITVGTNQNAISYNLSVQSLGSSLNNGASNYSSQEGRFILNVSPPIPSGTTINFVMNVGYQIQNMGPWFNDSPSQTATYNIVPMLYKNGVDISSQLILGTTNSVTTNRPGCNPSEMEVSTGTYTVSINMTYGDVVSGYTFTELSMLNPVVFNGCVSTIDSNLSIYNTNTNVSGCYCCSLVSNPQPLTFNQTLVGAAYGN